MCNALGRPEDLEATEIIWMYPTTGYLFPTRRKLPSRKHGERLLNYLFKVEEFPMPQSSIM
jgi:hypothetical protein